MYFGKTVAMLLPARNEEEALPVVLKSIPVEIDRVLVLDNGSTDNTSALARAAGAEVIFEPVAGYGRACLAGLKELAKGPVDIVVFMDADGSDDISCLSLLLAPLIQDKADFVLAQRIPQEKAALSWQQRGGNLLATVLIRLVWGHRYHDLGPMRAITWEGLKRLDMQDRDYGWTVEMQIRALKAGLRILEYPTPYHKRSAGRSKISRTVTGTLKAGGKILWVIGREALSGW